MKRLIPRYVYLILSALLLCLFVPQLQAQSITRAALRDSLQKSRFRLSDDRTAFQTTENPGGLNTKLPSNLTKTIEYDPVTNEYVFREKIGQTDYRLPYSLTPKEYRAYDLKKSTKLYWNEKRQNDKNGGGSGSFLPKLNLGGEAFDKIFGTNAISIVPQGSAELIFALNTQEINNPNISENLRKTTTFDFQEKIQMNVTGSIGDKMKVGINYNTEATFDFENKTKLEYTGKEDEIIRKIEAGNVSLPLSGSLITGSQSLFGLKTELQFGKLNVTTVISQQKSESSVIEVKGGSQVSTFSIACDSYEANKHFFLSQFFKDRYESSLKTIPTVSSGVTITKIEVWVTNKNSTYQDSRNIVAFMDLGEAHPWNKISSFAAVSSQEMPFNTVNGLYNSVINTYGVRTIKDVSTNLAPLASQGFYVGQDFEKVESARKLSSSEYTYQPNLGYISLSSALNSDEILAVAYEYTYNGRTYKVGELSTSGITSPQALVLKLLKGTSFVPKLPTWKRMMKNIYSINAYQVNKDNFKLNVLYQSDKSGTALNYIPEDQTSSDILLKVENLDRLNTNNDEVSGGDGVFDFVEGLTVNASNGRIIFPTLEPFGGTLETYLKKKGVSASTIQKYLYTQLYDSTQTVARQITEKDKFILKGTYQGSSSSEISLNATNVAQGSVVVTAGGRQLVENSDYTVDYTLGRVKIINSGLLESGTAIKISLENNSLYNFKTKTLIGTHLNYKLSDNFNLGATVMNLTERPLTSKVNIGDEPISNTIWGLNGTYTTKSQFLTTMLDKLPFLNVKEPSTITIDGEFAQLIPGHSSAINNCAYIDDFEGSESAIDMRSFQSWSLASTPSDSKLFPESSKTNDLSYGYNRAKIAWYVIDPIFLTNTSTTPAYIRKNANLRSSHFVRQVYEEDIFKNVSNATGVPTNISVLNVAYYPRERGPYNYDTNIESNGSLKNPKTRWGGIQREVTTSDFETANISYIEFWLMDPFVEDTLKTHKGGALYFDLGNVSEDVLKDSRKAYENGLPKSATVTDVDTTVWGRVAASSSLVNAFDNDANSRRYQDIGLDGLNDDDEKSFFGSYLNALKGKSQVAYEKALEDPSSDDFHYYRGSDYDAEQLGILERYKKYNGLEGNSPALSASGDSYSGSSTPNTEDLNHDNTLNESESFFQYKVDITRDKLKIGSNFIVDSVVNTVKFANGTHSSVNWYQFRIPINSYYKTIGSISDFKSIRFMRMFLNGFEDSVILRFARLQLIRGEWRKYNLSFRSGSEAISTPEESDATFEISAVNIEQNSGKKPVNYVLPPGVSRQVDPSNTTVTELNEQAMALKVYDLPNGDARAAYKTLNLDVRKYRRLKMDVHAEQIEGTTLKDDDLTLFVRIGSDYTNNFYEYEVPLKLTPYPTGFYNNDSQSERTIVWPDENRIDIALDDLQSVKQARNVAMTKNNSVTSTTVFPYTFDGEKGTYYVCGYPNLSNLKTIMIGIRHPYNASKKGQVRSAEVWVNELRLSEFDERKGWAGNLRVNSRLSDFGSISMAGSIVTNGFGSIDSNTSTRSNEDVQQYSLATNLDLGKFFPKKTGIQIPMYYGFSRTLKMPYYNPYDPDMTMSATLKGFTSQAQRDSMTRLVQDLSITQSINFTNVRINGTSQKKHFYDLSNWSLNYSFSETYSRNYTTEHDVQKNYSGGLMYSYVFKPKIVSPFQRIGFLRGNAFKLIRDFNFQLLPNSFSFRTEMVRNYNEIKLRDVENSGSLVQTTVSKDFLWNRYYDFSYDITKSLKLDFSATNIARIDEPAGIVDKDFKDSYQHWKDSVMHNILRGGRTTHYQHDINVNYTIPINKLPYLDWTNATARYNATYDWSAAALDTLRLGNTINNSNTLRVDGQLSLNSLYNKFPFLRRFGQSPAANKQKIYKKVVFERDRMYLRAKMIKPIVHKLGTSEVKVKAYDSSGQEIKGKTVVVNDNKVNFIADKDYSDVRFVVEGKIEQKTSPVNFVVDNATRLLLSVKNVSVSWSRTEGTTLPGFLPGTKLLGMSTADNLHAPGLPFIFGVQDDNFVKKAINNHWLSTSGYLNSPLIMTYNESVQVRAQLEPIPDLKITLTGIRTYTRSKSAYYTADAKGQFPDSTRNAQETGNFSISFIAIGSAFEKLKSSDNYNSPVFNKFKSYRAVIAKRLGDIRKEHLGANYSEQVDLSTNSLISDGSTNGYGLTSQSVLIPAFMSAYGGMDPESVTLNKFPSFWHMMPNWTANYEGLSKLPFLKNTVRSISLTHSYKASYNIGSFTSNSEYDLEEILNEKRDLDNNFIPRLDVSSVSIVEQFGPLVGIDVKFKNNLSTKFEKRKNRNIVLSLVNSQLTETLSDELVIGAGYKFNNITFIIKSASAKNPFKSDLNLTADLSIRDNKTIIRRLSNESDEPSQGQKVVTIKVAADYSLSEKFNIRLFYDRIVNTPFVETSYPTATTNVGFSVRFSLTQ